MSNQEFENKNKGTPPKREKPNKIVIIGDSNVGKTCLIDRYCDDKFGDTQPTIGALHKIKTVNDVQLDIWDTAGQERFKSMIPMYYKGARAIIIAYDVTSIVSFDGAKKWLQEIESNTSNILIILIANKIDLESKRIVSKDMAKNFAEQKNIIYYETSAKDNINIKEVFDYIAKEIKNLNLKNDNSINIKQEVNTQSSQGCSCGY
jgi:small GTP-binding protein